MVKVQLLNTPSCSSCAVVEKMLDKMGVKYELIDITKKSRNIAEIPYNGSPGCCYKRQTRIRRSAKGAGVS